MSELETRIYHLISNRFRACEKHGSLVKQLIDQHVQNFNLLNRTTFKSAMKQLRKMFEKAEWSEVKYMFGALFVLIVSEHKPQLHLRHISELYVKYPEFEQEEPEEQQLLFQFRNLFIVAIEIIDPKNKKCELLGLIGRICGAVYVTGGGQTRATDRRVLIFERETGIEPRKFTDDRKRRAHEARLGHEWSQKNQDSASPNAASMSPELPSKQARHSGASTYSLQPSQPSQSSALHQKSELFESWMQQAKGVTSASSSYSLRTATSAPSPTQTAALLAGSRPGDPHQESLDQHTHAQRSGDKHTHAKSNGSSSGSLSHSIVDTTSEAQLSVRDTNTDAGLVAVPLYQPSNAPFMYDPITMTPHGQPGVYAIPRRYTPWPAGLYHNSSTFSTLRPGPLYVPGPIPAPAHPSSLPQVPSEVPSVFADLQAALTEHEQHMLQPTHPPDLQDVYRIYSTRDNYGNGQGQGQGQLPYPALQYPPQQYPYYRNTSSFAPPWYPPPRPPPLPALTPYTDDKALRIAK